MLPKILAATYEKLIEDKSPTAVQNELRAELSLLSDLLDRVMERDAILRREFGHRLEHPMMTGRAPGACPSCGRVFE